MLDSLIEGLRVVPTYPERTTLEMLIAVGKVVSLIALILGAITFIVYRVKDKETTKLMEVTMLVLVILQPLLYGVNVPSEKVVERRQAIENRYEMILNEEKHRLVESIVATVREDETYKGLSTEEQVQKWLEEMPTKLIEKKNYNIKEQLEKAKEIGLEAELVDRLDNPYKYDKTVEEGNHPPKSKEEAEERMDEIWEEEPVIEEQEQEEETDTTNITV